MQCGLFGKKLRGDWMGLGGCDVFVWVLFFLWLFGCVCCFSTGLIVF